jgi:hypothetical protein
VNQLGHIFKVSLRTQDTVTQSQVHVAVFTYGSGEFLSDGKTPDVLNADHYVFYDEAYCSHFWAISRPCAYKPFMCFWCRWWGLGHIRPCPHIEWVWARLSFSVWNDDYNVTWPLVWYHFPVLVYMSNIPLTWLITVTFDTISPLAHHSNIEASNKIVHIWALAWQAVRLYSLRYQSLELTMWDKGRVYKEREDNKRRNYN